LGYLIATCAHLHNAVAPPPPVGQLSAQDAGARAASHERALASMLGVTSRYRSTSKPAATRIVAPGDAAASVLALRMRSRNPFMQMPPIGTRLADVEALALIENWINHDLQPPKESTP
jgi:hypothetical protein